MTGIQQLVAPVDKLGDGPSCSLIRRVISYLSDRCYHVSVETAGSVRNSDNYICSRSGRRQNQNDTETEQEILMAGCRGANCPASTQYDGPT